MGVGGAGELVPASHLGAVVAADRRHVPDGSRLSAETLAPLVRSDLHRLDRLDRTLLLLDGVDDQRCRYVICFLT